MRLQRLLHAAIGGVLAFAAGLAIALIAPNAAQAHAKILDGHCGIHPRFRLYPYPHRWAVRIGYAPSYPGQRCYGFRGSAIKWGADRAPYAVNGLGILDWLPFKIPHPTITKWDWKGMLDLGVKTAATSAACGAFAGALVGEVPSGGSDSLVTVGLFSGCVLSAESMKGQLDHEAHFIK